LKKVWWYGDGAGFSRQMEGFVDLLFSNHAAAKCKGALRSAGSYFRERRL
jgi:hypothetical protein